MDDPYKRIAEEIAGDFLRKAGPKPSAGPVKLLAMVGWALSHGYTRSEIERALPNLASFTLPALEFVLRRAHIDKGPRPNISTWDRQCPLGICEAGVGWVVHPECPDKGMVRCACNPSRSS